MSDDWLTVEEAAAAYGVTSKTIRRRIHAGKLSHRKEPGVRGAVLVEPPRAVEGQVIRQVDNVDTEGQNMSLTVPEQMDTASLLGTILSQMSSQAEDVGALKARIARLEAELAALKERRPWWRRWTRG